ncbi:MAG TPA: histidine phosphatase family protein [Propionibacteriaceae bacterium]|nr:histidine phosphatase family protein [Propionibacteriaceae bacterium]
MTTVLLVRHGRTTANTSGILAGRSSGVELDDTGRRQAAAAGQRLGPIPLRALVSSPLRRCRQTAQALQAGRDDGLATTIDQGLTECGYGEWTGRSLKDLSKEKLWQTVQQQPSAVRFPGGESMVEMASRAVGAVRSWDAKLTEQFDHDAIWVAVSHGDVIKAVLADALGLHLDGFQRILVDPASISVVRYTSARPYVVMMNSTTAELSSLFPPPAAKPRRARRPKNPDDAPVGGGLGAADALD